MKENDVTESAFKAVGLVEETVRWIDRASARSVYRVYLGAGGFEAAIPEEIVERAKALGRRSDPNEWHGTLVGEVCEDAEGRHVIVRGIVPDADARASSGYVETTTESEWKTRTLARVLYPDCVILGWIHGHVRIGAWFSSTDKRTQATWTQPHAVGVVVDPWDRDDIAVYRGPASERLRRVGAACAAERPATRQAGAKIAATEEATPTRKRTSSRTLGILALVAAALALAYGVSTGRSLEERLSAIEKRENAPPRAVATAANVPAREPEEAREAIEPTLCVSEEEFFPVSTAADAGGVLP